MGMAVEIALISYVPVEMYEMYLMLAETLAVTPLFHLYPGLE